MTLDPVTTPIQEPSPAGLIVRGMVRHFPDEWASDLHLLLSHRLAADTPSDLRYIRLGLVLQLIMRDGQPPSGEEYDALRAGRMAQGEDWPERTALSDHYGGWANVVRCAMDLYDIGTSARVPSNWHHHKEPGDAYTPVEVEMAIIRCQEKLGYWPPHQMFLLWAQLERRAARTTGKGVGRDVTQDRSVRWPSMTPIRRIYGHRGGYPNALAAARRRYEATAL